MERFEDSLEVLKPVETLEKEDETAKIKSKAKKAVIIGVTVALAGVGVLAFNESNEEEVSLYGPAPVLEETSKEEVGTEPEIKFDPKMEEVICDYGVPTTRWGK